MSDVIDFEFIFACDMNDWNNFTQYYKFEMFKNVENYLFLNHCFSTKSM